MSPPSDTPPSRRSTPRSRWTSEDEHRLVELYGEEVPLAVIAAELDRTEAAVNNRLSMLRGIGSVRSKRFKDWTTDDDRLLLEGLAAGRDASTVARELGRSEGAVGNRRRELVRSGCTVPDRIREVQPWSQSEDDRIVQLYLQEVVVADIARAVGREPHVVNTRLAALRAGGVSLPPRKLRWTAEEKRRLVRRRQEGASYKQLSREFGRAHGSISVQLKALRDAGESE